jgi:hypothetical protein
MPAHTDKRPRHFAEDLTDAWVRGQPTDAILAGMPEVFRGLARAHAKSYCEKIQFHRRAGTPRESIMGAQLAEWVEIYSARLAAK